MKKSSGGALDFGVDSPRQTSGSPPRFEPAHGGWRIHEVSM